MLKSGWNWSTGFSPGGVTVTLVSPPWIKGTAKDNVIHFVKETIETWLRPGEPGRYPMAREVGYFNAYKNHLLDSRDLAGLSFRESTGLLREKLDEFFAPGSDYDRIETYLRCLAFDSREEMPEHVERPTWKNDGEPNASPTGRP